MTTTLYHGSTEDHGATLAVVKKGIFGGLFAADRHAAESHGGYLYAIEIADDRVLTRYALAYSCDYIAVVAACAVVAPHINSADLADAVTESDEDVAELLNESDPAEASWEAQRLVGAVAAHLGYLAVEMPDEHGTSYLVLPGANFGKIAD